MSTRRDRERGGIMIVIMVTLVALLGLGGLALLSATTSTRSVGHERFHAMALYAAESGVTAGMEYLREHRDSASYWSELVVAGNQDVEPLAAIAGNGVRPSQTGRTLSDGHNAWYEVVVLNNPGDPGFAAGEDRDGRVILRSTGYGPDGVVVVVEVEVAPGMPTEGAPCPGYAQRNQDELGRALNPCLSAVSAAASAVFTPGGEP